jgi:hypothetical protein
MAFLWYREAYLHHISLPHFFGIERSYLHHISLPDFFGIQKERFASHLFATFLWYGDIFASRMGFDCEDNQLRFLTVILSTAVLTS